MANITNIFRYELHKRVLSNVQTTTRSTHTMLSAVPMLDDVPDLNFLFRFWRINWFQLFENFVQVDFVPVDYKYEEDINAIDAGRSEQEAVTHFFEMQGGFIPKFVQHFEDRGWFVVKDVKPSAGSDNSTMDNLNVDVAIAAYNGPKDNYASPRMRFNFYGVDPNKLEKSNPSCRVEYEAVEVPARTVYKAKVVCDDQPEPAQLDEGDNIEQRALQEATN